MISSLIMTIECSDTISSIRFYLRVLIYFIYIVTSFNK